MASKEIKITESVVYTQIDTETVPAWVIKVFNKDPKRSGDIRVKGKTKRYIIRVTFGKPTYYEYKRNQKDKVTPLRRSNKRPKG